MVSDQARTLSLSLRPPLLWTVLFFLYVYLYETFPVSKLLQYCIPRGGINTSNAPTKRALLFYFKKNRSNGFSPTHPYGYKRRPVGENPGNKVYLSYKHTVSWAHLLKLIFKASYSDAWPSYPKFGEVVHTCLLHSNAAKLLVTPPEKGSFQDSAVQLFNSLPVHVRNSTDFHYFCRKTHFFLRNHIQ